MRTCKVCKITKQIEDYYASGGLTCKKCNGEKRKNIRLLKIANYTGTPIPSRPNEYWKDLPGFEGIYKVSSIGRIFSLDRMIKNRYDGYTLFKGGVKIPTINKGYLRYCLTDADGKKQHLPAHRAVSLAFIENSEGKPFVNHINGIKTDNRVSNLEWVTAKENSDHAIKSGLTTILRGAANNRCTIPFDTVKKIREEKAKQDSLSATARKYSVSVSTVKIIQLNKTRQFQ